MCGIVGICAADVQENVIPDLLEATLCLQHRGQEACGAVASDASGAVTMRPGIGLVSEVFGQRDAVIEQLRGHMGVSHVRYPTNGNYTDQHVQPLVKADAGNIALAHNGNLTNTKELIEYIDPAGPVSLNNFGDSQMMLELFVSKLNVTGQIGSVDRLQILSGVSEIYNRCRGAFACVIMIPLVGMLGFRDANGIKPLIMGYRNTERGQQDIIFASESAALQRLGFGVVADVRPGEAIFVPIGSQHSMNTRYISHQVVSPLSYTPDIFEFVYFASANSVIDRISVNQSRRLMGKALAQTIVEQMGPQGSDVLSEIDCVIPVPETSYTGALAVSQHLGIPFALGLVRNKYVFRTFILPGQTQRVKGVQRKLSAVREEFEDRNVLIIDDSVVRGTTSTQIVAMARQAGAKKVFLASCSPAIRFNHIHGIDLADEKALVAHNRTNEQIQQILQCDQIVYLPLERLVKACIDAGKSATVSQFEVGVFTGKYVTDNTTPVEVPGETMSGKSRKRPLTIRAVGPDEIHEMLDVRHVLAQKILC